MLVETNVVVPKKTLFGVHIRWSKSRYRSLPEVIDKSFGPVFSVALHTEHAEELSRRIHNGRKNRTGPSHSFRQWPVPSMNIN